MNQIKIRFDRTALIYCTRDNKIIDYSMAKIGHYYSPILIYVLPHMRTFDLRTNFSERFTLYMYSKFNIHTSLLNVIEFNICTIQSTHNKYRRKYIEVQRPHRVTWGLWGIGSSGLKLSRITSNPLEILG